MKQIQIIIYLMSVVLMSSCLKSDDHASGNGDAIVVAKQIGSKTMYGLSLYAYSFSNFKTVSAVSTSATDKTYQLKANQEYKTNFYYETPNAEFSETIPAATTFNFSAVFENGGADTFQDILSNKVLAVPSITKCEYSQTRHMLEISWSALTGVDSYAINILDGTKIVFGSLELANTVLAQLIIAPGDGWITGFTPQAGKTYTVRLYGFLYEPNLGSYNLQASSIAETTVVWGN